MVEVRASMNYQLVQIIEQQAGKCLVNWRDAGEMNLAPEKRRQT
jgi:hypothetical protein